jgi:hypothetical protein
LLQLLNADFAVKDLGDLHYFLGVEVLKLTSGLLLSTALYHGSFKEDKHA